MAATATSVDPSDSIAAQRRGILEMVIASVSLGILGPVASIAYTTGLSPTVFSALRAAIGAAILGAIVLLGLQPRARLGDLPVRQQRMLAAAVILNGLQNLALFLAYGQMSVALVLIVFYLYPVIVTAASAATGRDRLTQLRVAALALAMVGLALVLGAQVGPDAHATPAGVALAAFAALCHAGYYLVVRDGFPHVPALQATSLVLAGGFVISGIAALATLGTGMVGTWVADPTAWAMILVAGTIGAAFPKVLVIRAVRAIGGTRASLVALLEPVTGVVVATLALGQTLEPQEIVGGATILIAAALVQRREPEPVAPARFDAEATALD